MKKAEPSLVKHSTTNTPDEERKEGQEQSLADRIVAPTITPPLATTVTPGPPIEQPKTQPPTQVTTDTMADNSTYTSPNELRADDLQQTSGSASKITFADDETGTPLPKRLFTLVHNVAPTTHYTKLMGRTGRVPLSSRRVFISMGAKDDLDGDSIDNAAATMVLVVKKYYPREYHNLQLVSANTMKMDNKGRVKKDTNNAVTGRGSEDHLRYIAHGHHPPHSAVPMVEQYGATNEHPEQQC